MDSFDDYQLATLRTWKYLPGTAESLDNSILGLVGELGEFAEILKKDHHHGIPADHMKIFKELGDLMYYLARACDDFHFNMSEVAEANIEKLRKRYPDGFREGGGNREGE